MIDDYCCTNAVESNVCQIAVCRRHGYRVHVKPGHSRQELPGEFARIEGAMRRAKLMDRALFAAMYQMAATVNPS